MTLQINNQNSNTIDLNGEPNIKSNELAIDMRSAFFHYTKDVPILKNVSLKIPKGKIFSLLGPNGTGKTTLLRTILGSLQLNSGLIKVFGMRPGSKYCNIPGPGVGYMPQELALFEEFTVEEILRYYGTLYHMNDKKLTKSIDDLIQILNLPEKSRLINKLSGGQQRRVSIAITMVHSPKLVILDEPTVGVDSLLRHRIWQYLNHCCHQNGQTVLITTHYIGEAKSAANIAFMNYGTILKQSNPQTLLREYNCQTLESVFLLLCEQTIQTKNSIKDLQKVDENEEKSDEQVFEEAEEESIKVDQNINRNFDLMRTKAMLFKYYTLSVRKPIFLYLFYFMPFLALASLKIALGQYPTNIPMIIVNQDIDPQYSNVMIDSIDRQHIDLRFSESNETAFESVLNGNNYMSVVFGENFSDTFEYRLKNLFDITDEEIEESKIKVYVDFSNAPMGIFVLKYLLRAFNLFLDRMSDTFGKNAQRFFHLVTVEESINGEFELDLAEVFGPGVLLALSQMLPLIISALQVVFDRKNSSLERILVSGVQPFEIFLAHLLQNCLLIGTQLLMSLFFSFVVFQNRQNGSYFDIYLLLFLIGVQGMTFGFLIALLMKDEPGVGAGIFLFVIPLWLISGVFWPIEAIPLNFRNVVQFSPLFEPLQALRSIMFRGWPLTHPGVYNGFIVNLIYIFIISIFNIVFFTKLTK